VVQLAQGAQRLDQGQLAWVEVVELVVAVDQLCQLAEARQLCLFHHEPALDDAALTKMLEETQRYEEITRTGQPVRVSAAYDGLELTL
jgi:phosphoribosyl 1,2-cyclic phosphodiesterase